MISSNLDLTNDDRSFTCPISLQIMRHPVCTSSGMKFELKMLHEVIKRGDFYCPLTRKLITEIHYDEALKKTIDATYNESEDRFEEYDKNKYLISLSSFLNPLRYSIISSCLSGLCFGIIMYVISKNLFFLNGTNEKIESDLINVSMLVSFFIAAADLSTRMRSQHRFGLFGNTFNVGNVINRHDDLDDDNLAMRVNGYV
jgi:hypothetical protein